jgi:hypothetical protein
MQPDTDPKEVTKALIIEGTKLYMELAKDKGDPEIYWRTCSTATEANIISLTSLMLKSNAQSIIW